VLSGLIAAIQSHRGKRAAGEGGFAVAGLFNKLRFAGTPRDWEDTTALPEGDPACIAFSRFRDLWASPRGGDWNAHRDRLDAMAPAPDQTLAAATHALIADRFFMGHSRPDWRRVLGQFGA
jgi:hypothetical protein